MNEIAYDRNRIIIFGGAGVAIAALLIMFFIPVETEIHVRARSFYR